MTPIESIYEIRSDVLEIHRYLKERKPFVYHRAYERYEKLVNRFIRENVNLVEAEERIMCLDDVDYFLKLQQSSVNYYDLIEVCEMTHMY